MIRVAIAYAAVAFILIEAAGNIFPVLGLENWYPAVVVLGLTGFPVAMVLAWLFDLGPGGVVVTPPTDAVTHPTTRVSNDTIVNAALLDPKTVAVLPFDNLDRESEDDYFSDGITEEITARLSRVRDLRVVSRTSVMVYKDVKKNIRQVGRDLGAGSVVEGSVRRAQGRVRITAQLIDARSDEHLWADSYNRSLEDIFAIQSDVAESIAGALQAELSPSEVATLERKATDDLQAYDAYLKGRFLYNLRTEDGIRKSVGFLEDAIQRDPVFALAHAGLADSFVLLGLYNAERPDRVMPRAKASAQDALRLDPRLGEALTALACVRSIYDWDWAAAEVDFKKAVEANPRYPTAYHWYAMNHLAPRGRIAQALLQLDKATDLDPQAPVLAASRGFLYYLEDRLDDAARVLKDVLTANPRFALAHFFLGQVLEQQQRYEHAMDAFEAASAIRGKTPEILTAMGNTAALAGEQAQALGYKGELVAMSADTYVSPGRIGQVCFTLGQVDEAFDWMNKALEIRAIDLIWARVLPVFQPHRGEPRFQALLGAIGLDT